MKLYTEEEIREAYRQGWEDGNKDLPSDMYIDKVVDWLYSIELPSDDEIEKKAEDLEYTNGTFGFTECAKWMKEQIQNKS